MNEAATTIDYSVKLAATIDEITAGMAGLLAWSRAHPTIHLFRSGASWGVMEEEGCDAIDIARAMKDGAPIGAVTKRAGGGNNEDRIWIERDFGGEVRVFHIAEREQVCTRRVVGTKPVEIPDPDAPKITVEQDIVEWDCHPILESAS